MADDSAYGRTKVQGIKFPLKFYSGRVSLSNGDKHIRESIVQIIGTAKGEYLLKPTFGSDLPRRVFDTVNVMPLVRLDVKTAIEKFEKRVDVTSIEAQLSSAALGEVGIHIEYRLKGTQESNTLQFSLKG